MLFMELRKDLLWVQNEAECVHDRLALDEDYLRQKAKSHARSG